MTFKVIRGLNGWYLIPTFSPTISINNKSTIF
jgi:hypothetical protein